MEDLLQVLLMEFQSKQCWKSRYLRWVLSAWTAGTHIFRGKMGEGGGKGRGEHGSAVLKHRVKTLGRNGAPHSTPTLLLCGKRVRYSHQYCFLLKTGGRRVANLILKKLVSSRIKRKLKSESESRTDCQCDTLHTVCPHSPVSFFIETVLRDGLVICWLKRVTLGLNKRCSWILIFLEDPPSLKKKYSNVLRLLRILVTFKRQFCQQIQSQVGHNTVYHWYN